MDKDNKPADESGKRDGLPTGPGTSANNDVADPHPATEENYDGSRNRKSVGNGPNLPAEPPDGWRAGPKRL